eukprot:6741196-Alexandrium_andersonii.AAC.1
MQQQGIYNTSMLGEQARATRPEQARAGQNEAEQDRRNTLQHICCCCRCCDAVGSDSDATQ